MNEPGPWGRDAAPAVAEAGAVRREPFLFTGSTREYFGIWIVNILLTVLTLGIYSAWAKVRRLRYFYGNTRLAGSAFDYHARPVQILIGRIIVLALLVAYNLALQVWPVQGLLLGVAFVFLVPFFVMRGLRFNARVTSYRNVRFDFSGGYWGALRAYVLGGILTWVSLGLLAPLASRWTWSYTLGNLSYGGRPVTCRPGLGALYRQWWLPAFVLVGGLVFFGGSVAALTIAFSDSVMALVSGSSDASLMLGAILAILYAVAIPFLVLLGVAALLYRAGTRNVGLGSAVVDRRHSLRSAVPRWRFAWVAISNLVATILTLGFARPWAAVRMARFMAAATALDVAGSLDDFVSAVCDEGGAVGSEYMDVEGFDFGF